MSPPLRFGVSYDLRNPPDSGISNPELYAETLEQMVWIESLGFDVVWTTEHHFIDDGYLPSWVPLAGAVAARTQRLRFATDICLLPFNHPLRLAEDLAVLDNLSNGRVELGVGMGYAPHEFRGFGIPLPRRVSLMDEGLEVLRRCFAGERFSFQGKRYQFEDVVISPGYVQPGGPPLWVAAMSEAGARRAARFDCNLLPQGPREEVLDPWHTDLARSGRDASNYRVGIIRGILVTDDAEGDWPEIRQVRALSHAALPALLRGERRGPGPTGRAHSADLDRRQRGALRGGARAFHPRVWRDGHRHMGGSTRSETRTHEPQPGTTRQGRDSTGPR